MFYTDKSKAFRGRKAKIGTPWYVTDENGKQQLGVCLGYCPDCQKKVLASFDEARNFANKYTQIRKQPRFKLMLWTLRKLSGVDVYEKEILQKVKDRDRQMERLANDRRNEQVLTQY